MEIMSIILGIIIGTAVFIHLRNKDKKDQYARNNNPYNMIHDNEWYEQQKNKINI